MGELTDFAFDYYTNQCAKIYGSAGQISDAEQMDYQARCRCAPKRLKERRDTMSRSELEKNVPPEVFRSFLDYEINAYCLVDTFKKIIAADCTKEGSIQKKCACIKSEMDIYSDGEMYAMALEMNKYILATGEARRTGGQAPAQPNSVKRFYSNIESCSEFAFGQGKLSPEDLAQKTHAMARLEAEIQGSINEYNKSPRRFVVVKGTEDDRFLRYIETWRNKVESVGNQNYPETVRGKIHGTVYATVSIASDGTLKAVEINRSSGYKVLDDAVRNIAKIASPYAPFPPAIRRDTDIIEIARTWTFGSSVGIDQPIIPPEQKAKAMEPALLEKEKTQAWAERLEKKPRRVYATINGNGPIEHFAMACLEKIASYGNANYPEAARGKLYGSTLVTFELMPDGSIRAPEIVKSSGYAILDNFTIRIIRSASPCEPFTDEIRGLADIVGVARSFHYVRKESGAEFKDRENLDINARK